MDKKCCAHQPKASFTNMMLLGSSSPNPNLWRLKLACLSLIIHTLSPPIHPSYSLPGSCWAYATVAAIESAYSILRNDPSLPPPSLNVSQLLHADGRGGCSGGSPINALNYLVQLSQGGGGLTLGESSSSSSSSSSKSQVSLNLSPSRMALVRPCAVTFCLPPLSLPPLPSPAPLVVALLHFHLSCPNRHWCYRITIPEG